MQDYALWEVIEYGNSFKPVARTTTNAYGTSTSTIPGRVTTEEKVQKKIDVKARSMLLMALLNEHQLTFSQYKDAKTLFEAIQARFGGDEATKKTQKTLLKQMYKNFSASSQESLDSISNRLQKIVSYSNEDNTSNVQVNTSSTNVSTASTNDSTTSLSDATIYAFLANQPNGSQVVHEDLEQIHEDDLEEIDLKWQLTLLSLKARKFYQRIGKKIIINGSDTAGYDKSKVECFNCHKMGHFERESIGPRNQESRPRNQESSKRTVNVEDTSSKAMVAFDGAGFDWSFMADEEVPTNLALMAFSKSDLRVELNKSKFDLDTNKRGLAYVEEQLVFYKKNEVMLCDQIAVLKRDASFRDSEINALNIQIEKLKKEKESNQIKIDKFENASKSLDKLIGSQISDNNRKGVGYNAVPPPPTGLFAPPTIDLSSSGLKEFQQPEFEGYGVNVNKSVSENSSNEIKKTNGAPIIEDWVSDCDEDESEVMESDNVQHKSEPKPEQAKQPRKISENPRNNRTNWNEKKTQKLGVGFKFTKKACFVCGSFSHLIKDCDFHDKKMVQKPVMNNVQKGTGQREVRPVQNNDLRTDHQNFSNSRRNFAPTAVLTKSGIVPISTARKRSSRTAAPLSVARPINTTAPKLFVNVAKTKPNVFQKVHSLSRRPFNQKTTLNNKSLNNKVNNAKVKYVNTAKGKRVTSAIGKKGINAVKSSACWVWIPKRNIVDHTSKNSGSYICKQFDYGDPQVALKYTWIFESRCSKHMTRNKSYLTDYQDYDRGFVAFAGSSKGGRITGKGKIKTGKLDFKDLPDENQVMLKIPKKDNMYSFDLKNVVPSKEVCLQRFLKMTTHVLLVRKESNTKPLFCGIKGIKREFSNARTPQQNGVAERKNRTLIEAVRTMVLVTKPHNKTPYELLIGKTPIISFMRPFGCPVTILNTLDHLGKFNGKADERFLVGYSINSKAFRVFNSRTRKVEENLHVNFLENKPNVAGSRPEWLFDIDTLTNSMNYHPKYILLPLLHISSNVPSNSKKDESSPKDDAGKKNEVKDSVKEGNMNGLGEATNTDSTNRLNTVSSPVNTVSSSFTTMDHGRAKE
ncbi:ribonuclease H-like domain-containing protein [Tanacetum coccineum]